MALKVNDIKVRQICFIFLALMPVNKVLMLPSMMAEYAGEQLFLSMLLNFSMDILALFLILKIGDRFKNQTLFDILSNQFGETFAQITYFLLGVFFLLKSFIPIIEQKYFIDKTLYEVFPNIISFFPLFILSAYACVKGLKVLGRCSDFAIWFTTIAMILAFLFALPSAKLSWMMPILQKPKIGILNGAYTTITWFSESLYMLMFLGHFEYKKHTKLKIILSYTISAVVIILFSIVFYSVFGPIARTQIFALSNMTVFTTKIINSARYDFLAIFLLLFSKVFAICLPVLMSTKCFERAFKQKKGLPFSIVVNLILLLLVALLNEKIFAVHNFIKTYLNQFFIVIAYLFPLLLFIFLKRRKNEKSQE